ncbi:MAG: PrgI family protein [Candidatus Moranbacteria bacterium]|nr:PrgI family protein [Candidatus Moranbacteria bacterium]
MMFSVPQFIDVEDKIAGPLTWKQLGWMIGMGTVIMLFFKLFDTTLFIIATIPTVLLFVIFAFYRPNGFPMTTFVFYTVLFLFRPKIAVWRRSAEKKPEVKPVDISQSHKIVPSKQMSEEKLRAFAKILDNQNMDRK